MLGHLIADRPVLKNSAWSYLHHADFLMGVCLKSYKSETQVGHRITNNLIVCFCKEH
jgi:hypothetical protein